MKNIISIFVLILSIISCSGGNSGNTKQTENTQTNQTQTNEQVYINPTTTNKTKYTNEYVQGTEMYPMYSHTLDESLFLAVKYNNIEEVKSYLDKGANPNAQDEYGFTALMYATLIDIARLLIEEGTDVNIKDNAGATALMYTARDTNYEMVEFLLKNGADVNSQKGGSTALILACKPSLGINIDVIKYLVSKNADINAQDNEGYTALNKTLTTMPDFEIAHFLIEQGADVNIKNEDQYTPLIYLGMLESSFYNISFQENRIKLAEVLLEKGADVNIENDHGDTALDIAENLKLREIADILKKAQRNGK